MKVGLFYFIMALVVIFAIETASLITIYVLRNHGVFYDPSLITQDYSTYLDLKDSMLGWKPKFNEYVIDGENLAPDLSRHDPLFSFEKPSCIDVFGDSFTWSAEVKDQYAWPAVLGSKLGCRVANFGGGGYGTDQAYLRFLSKSSTAKIVFLNHLAENIIRNVNQFRNLIYPSHQFEFKPRFIIEEGELKLVKTPEITIEEINRFLEKPELYLDNEYFIPAGVSGIQEIRFPYSATLFKGALKHWHIHAILSKIPRHGPFYDVSHESNGLGITVEILKAFSKEAKTRNQRPIVTIIPTCRDLRFYQENGIYPYQKLSLELLSGGYEHIDFGPPMIEQLMGDDPASLYVDCQSHLNEQGNKMLAEITFQYLKQQDLLPSEGQDKRGP